MDKNETIVSLGAVIAGHKSAAGGSMLFSSMVIFNDPAYLIIGVIGALVSVGSEYYDLKRLQRKSEHEGSVFIESIPMNLFKAFVIGLLFTIMSFLFLTQAGEAMIKHIFGLGVMVKLLPSFWMIGTVYLSTKSIAIYNKLSLKMGWM